jgi:hypothetical protein
MKRNTQQETRLIDSLLRLLSVLNNANKRADDCILSSSEGIIIIDTTVRNWWAADSQTQLRMQTLIHKRG